ncbi:hypothetical protein [Falsirhodobacter algicola]|uniref:Lipoprotein n=1 Tax=Falsirhodobacter algicola TaxID=2692330 RepID=A0A8J8MTD4_9RHOB|nr:hypothetical protein [Falsirhodobacter algicola]QUS35898.1 hypothetical protein GR316_06265 [Falsirhodobacter algicola]
MSHPLLMACILAFATLMALSGCGVDGQPVAPDGTDVFPADTQPEINR